MKSKINRITCEHCGLPAYVSSSGDIDRISCIWCGWMKYYCDNKLTADNIAQMHIKQFKNEIDQYFEDEKYIIELEGKINKEKRVNLEICLNCDAPRGCSIFDLLYMLIIKDNETAEGFEKYPQLANYVKIPKNCKYKLEHLLSRKKDE